ncbi:hypothetical protein HK103_003792, partial [Boothiomyces macroporosus]
MTHLWLRAETKKNEERSALTPSVAKTLMENGDSLLTQDLQSLLKSVTNAFSTFLNLK